MKIIPEGYVKADDSPESIVAQIAALEKVLNSIACTSQWRTRGENEEAVREITKSIRILARRLTDD